MLKSSIVAIIVFHLPKSTVDVSGGGKMNLFRYLAQISKWWDKDLGMRFTIAQV